MLIGVLGFLLYRHFLLTKLNKQLTQQSQTDKLTNLCNRLYLDQMLLQLSAQSERYKNNFTLILIDIDYFKSVNDQHGHLVGDQVLIEFASLLKSHTRRSDVVGRWGGEEFLIVCPETKSSEALLLAEKLRLTVSQHKFTTVVSKTASFGIAQYQMDETIESCLNRADQALYAAKKSGRNQVKVG